MPMFARRSRNGNAKSAINFPFSSSPVVAHYTLPPDVSAMFHTFATVSLSRCCTLRHVATIFFSLRSQKRYETCAFACLCWDSLPCNHIISHAYYVHCWVPWHAIERVLVNWIYPWVFNRECIRPRPYWLHFLLLHGAKAWFYEGERIALLQVCELVTRLIYCLICPNPQ